MTNDDCKTEYSVRKTYEFKRGDKVAITYGAKTYFGDFVDRYGTIATVMMNTPNQWGTYVAVHYDKLMPAEEYRAGK